MDRSRFSPLLILALLLVAACATKPTRVNENQGRSLQPAAPAVQADVVIDERTVVIDARPPFEYTLSHVPRAIPLQWSEFAQGGDGARGILQKDEFALARRLARLGISPDSKVVVVGRGTDGEGEEGRVAWTLLYLGVKNVTPLPLAYFKGPLTSQTGPPPQPVAIWKPEIDKDLLATREELLTVITKGGVHHPVVAVPKGGVAKRHMIIDVRTPREYLGKEGIGMKTQIPNMDAINISWKEFFGPDGRPNPAMREQLKQLGFDDQRRIIVVSERGLRSAAVTVALKSLGFPDVGNYAGGLTDLLAHRRGAKAQGKE